MTYNDWLHALYNALAIPHTTKNARCGVAWCYTESGAHGAGAWNPLNTTWRMPGSTDFNSVGVQNYQDFETGLHATVLTITLPGYGYPKILQRFRSPLATARMKLNAIEASAWGTSGLILDVFEDVKRDYDSRANIAVKGS